MLAPLVAVALLLSAADHWTTYLCLRSPVAGWEVTEANPLAAWLFHSMGLVEGLLFDSAVTLLAMSFLWFTPRLPRNAKLGFLAIVIAWTGAAVVNNVRALDALALSVAG